MHDSPSLPFSLLHPFIPSSIQYPNINPSFLPPSEPSQTHFHTKPVCFFQSTLHYLFAIHSSFSLFSPTYSFPLSYLTYPPTLNPPLPLSSLQHPNQPTASFLMLHPTLSIYLSIHHTFFILPYPIVSYSYPINAQKRKRKNAKEK